MSLETSQRGVVLPPEWRLSRSRLDASVTLRYIDAMLERILPTLLNRNRRGKLMPYPSPAMFLAMELTSAKKMSQSSAKTMLQFSARMMLQSSAMRTS